MISSVYKVLNNPISMEIRRKYQTKQGIIIHLTYIRDSSPYFLLHLDTLNTNVISNLFILRYTLLRYRPCVDMKGYILLASLCGERMCLI